MERIQRIRETDKNHHFTLVCRDLSEIAKYARVNNQQYRLLKSLTPGPYTFLLPATREVPKRLQNPKRRTIGIRVPDHVVTQHLLGELNEPLMSSTLLLPGDELPMTDAREIQERLLHLVDAVIDGGNCGLEPTTVIDLAGPVPVVVRQGRGEVPQLSG
jgi:tRNA threonylcarbamoyl adenosine modification protein (Sua5/YciO/YrdC/YwlC family)